MVRKREWAVFLLFLFAAALIMLVMTTSSPFYPTNPWGDVQCYMTVARGMDAGLMPYRDLMEHKGPLLYFVHYLAVQISPDGFLGVYLLEMLACAAFLFAGYRILRLLKFRAEYCIPLLIALAALLAASEAFLYGDSAEEMCTPLLAWSLYEALRYFLNDRKMSRACLLRNGVLAGCVFWIKYSLLGLHFAWMAVIAIDCVIQDRKIWRALKMCALFLAGMALASLPWLIYYAVNGALKDLIQVYIVENLTGYRKNVGVVYGILRGNYRGFRRNPAMGLALVAAGVSVLFSKRLPWRAKICALAMMACVGTFAYFSGQQYMYMFYAWACVTPLALIPLLNLIQWLEARRLLLARVGVAATAAVACCAAVLNANMLPRIGYPEEKLVQSVFSDVINQTENPTLLNCGFLDGGFYAAADVLPSTRWFQGYNIDQMECYRIHKGIIENEEVDYVVTRNFTLEELGIDGSAYALVMSMKDEYAIYGPELTYHLYRSRALDGAAQQSGQAEAEPQLSLY